MTAMVGVLDAAWAEAEAALPEGWHMHQVAFWVNRGDWVAQAGRIPFGHDLALGVGGTGPDPASALRDLATKLRERGVA